MRAVSLGVLLGIACTVSFAAAGAVAGATDSAATDEGYRISVSVCGNSQVPRALELADAVEQSLFAQPQLIIAQQDLVESRSDVRAAMAPFLPNATLSLVDEKYAPANGGGPVVVIGNNVLGGPQTRSGYGSLSLTWNIMNSGRDVAGLRGAKAGVRAAASGLDNQLEESLAGVLQSYADLYEAEVSATNEGGAAALLLEIYQRAQERYRHGNGTTVAIGQARTAELEAEQSFNRACRTVEEKAAALAEAVGVRIPGEQRLAALQPLPMPLVDGVVAGELQDIVEMSPAVLEAKEKVAAATARFQQAKRAFGPSVTFSARKDYLGQSPDSYGAANHHIVPNDYRLDLGFEQPLFPVATEVAAVDKARAEVRKSQAGYDQARLEVETKLRGALSAQREAEASLAAARASLRESQQVLTLTESLYRAGRTDLDSVQHAKIDWDKAQAETRTLQSRRAFAEWAVARALRPGQFPDLLFAQLHLRIAATRWRDGDEKPAKLGDMGN